ncbi:MAG: dienelactone hydrolase [Gammaproteobacteria bacterium]|jgi:dienelactone hydrolase
MPIVSQSLNYEVDGASYQAYFAYDSTSTEPCPGVLVIHEWWGVNGYIKSRVEQLAEAGYVALAVDMYGQGKMAADPDESGQLMTSVLDNMDVGTVRLRAGWQLLKDQPQVDECRTAAIGYCFGGAMALHMARIGCSLKAVASFHGALGSFHQAVAHGISSEILVCHGGADSMVSMDDLDTFKLEMNQVKANYEVRIFDGAKHGFTSREADANGAAYGLDLGYSELADQQSWDAMISLFKRTLCE